MNSSSPRPVEQQQEAEVGEKAGNALLDRPLKIRWGWCLAALLILVQWLLFRQYAEREIVWGYPAYFDQAIYLAQCHEIYDTMLRYGFWDGIFHSFTMALPTGRGLQIQGPILFLMFGASRMSALTLNFLYFAGFLAVLAYTLHWATRQWAIVFTGLGLVLASASRFFWAGGYMDFRLDFINACNYGILLCLVIRSEMFRSWGWSLLVGVQLALTLWLRLLMTPILALILSLLGLLFFYRSRAQFRNLLVSGFLALLLVLPCLIPTIRPSLSYYAGEVTSGAAAIRASEFAARTTAEWALYYLHSVAVDHLGAAFILLGALLVVASSLVLLMVGGRMRSLNVRFGGQIEGLEAIVFLGASFLAPLLVLTIYPVRSPVVGNILVAPVVGLILLPVVIAAGLSRAALHSPVISKTWIITVTATSMVFGVNNELKNVNRPGPHTGREEDTRKIVAFIDALVAHCKATGLKRPIVALDRIADYLNGATIRALAYERHGYLLRPEYSMPQQMFEIPESQAIENILKADLAIVRDRDAPLVLGYDYPFNVAIRKHQDRLRAAAAERFDRIATVEAFGEVIGLYARPAVRLSGELGGWITSRGVFIISSTESLKRWPLILLSGRTLRVGDLHESMDAFAELAAPAERKGEPVPATFQARGVTPHHIVYEILLDTSGLTLPQSPEVKIHLRFSKHFVLKEITGSNDDRELVIETPERVRLLTREEAGTLSDRRR
jgi:hypothetical protein